MLLPPLGEGVVLDAELALRGGDRTALGVGFGRAAFAGIREGRGAVLEELLLPEGEEVHREVVFLAAVRDGLVLQEVESEPGDLRFRGEGATLPGPE